jgi:hypothetical protein
VRGYKFVKGEKSGDASYTYWRNTHTGQCVIVHTANGRYESLVKALDADCRGGSSDAAPATAKGPGAQSGRFATVCGAMVEGKLSLQVHGGRRSAGRTGQDRGPLSRPDHHPELARSQTGQRHVRVMKAQQTACSTCRG